MSPAPTVSPPAPAAKSGKGLWLAVAAAVVLALAGGGTWFATRPPAVNVVAQLEAEAAAKEQAALKQQQQQEELDRLRAEKAKHDQETHDAEIKRQAAEEERQRLRDEETARQKALEADKTRAAEAEARLNLGALDRQHIQVALTALGFNTNGTAGTLTPRARDMVAAWQKSRSYPDTGYVTGAQNQELLRTAAAAVAKFDDDQKRAAAAATQSPQIAAVSPGPQTPPPPAPRVAGSPDGQWIGSYHCTPSKGGGPFTMPVRLAMQGGTGTHNVPNATATTPGNHSLAVTVTGNTVLVQRTYAPTAGPNVGGIVTGTMSARFEGGTITGTGPETNSGGRTCTIILTR